MLQQIAPRQRSQKRKQLLLIPGGNSNARSIPSGVRAKEEGGGNGEAAARREICSRLHQQTSQPTESNRL